MITDNTAKWKAIKLTEFAGKSLPVGFMHFSLEKEVPAGELPAYGYLYNRILYADLWAYAQTHNLVISESEWQAIASANGGNCAYYSSGDGSSTFRVPKLPNTIASDVPSEVPVVGNGMTLGLTNGTKNGGLQTEAGGNVGCLFGEGTYGTNVGTNYSNAYSTDKSLGITTDPTKSGIVAKTSSTKITGQWLIVAFGVAHNIGEADVADVMQAVEQVQTGLGKVDGIADYIVESYRNGTEWYEVYKSGKVRQGGVQILKTGTYNDDTWEYVQFILPFADKNYSFVGQPIYHSGNVTQTFIQYTKVQGSASINNLGREKNKIWVWWGGDGSPVSWIAEGQGA